MPGNESEVPNIACRVRSRTPPAWLSAVRADLALFLQDHAACERKASATAMAMASHYRDKKELVQAMIDLACEELDHFRRVYGVIAARGGTLGADAKDLYVARLLGLVRRGPEIYLLDRLLVAGVIEARGCERFRRLAEGLDTDLAELYRDFATSEAGHAALFIKLAQGYFAEATVRERLDQVLEAEAEIIQSVPLRPALH
jgi:tRNA-(ms[2]io[6]A)-hydroxylase